MDADFDTIEGFEWNSGNLEHIKKHNVTDRECEEVFGNRPLLVNQDIHHSQTEARWQVLGITNKERLVFLTFTIRQNNIRVISARDQNKNERREFKKVGGE